MCPPLLDSSWEAPPRWPRLGTPSDQSPPPGPSAAVAPYLSLGELAHKKDKRIEEIDRAIQQSHIQQELAAETLNPARPPPSHAGAP